MAWTSIADLSTARRSLAGAGTYYAAMSIGGYSGVFQDATEECDGMAWSSGGNINAGRQLLAACGVLTAGLTFGGQTSTPADVTTTEEYDGTSWAAGGNMSTARNSLMGCGIQTAGLAIAGTALATCEEYDGTSWAAGGSLAAMRAVGGAVGTQTSGLQFGGTATSTPESTTYHYDGAAWTSGGAMTAATKWLAGSGTQSEALAFGGYTTVDVATTTLYNGSTWSAGSNLNAAKRLLASANNSTGNFSLSFGGYNGSSNLATTELYYGAGTLVITSSLTSTFTLPAPSLPTYIGPSPLTATFTLPAPTIVSSIKVLPDPLTATFVIPDVIAGVGVVAVDPLVATFTMPTVTVSLPCIVTVSPLTGTFYILDPYAVVSQKSILFGAYNLPCSKTMSYKIVDDMEVTIQDWTTTGVTETVVDATANKSIYSVRTNKVNENFQGKIMWKSSDATPLTAVEIINIYSSYVDILQNRLTNGRATNLDDIPTRLAASAYTAPDNAGIAANGAAINALPTLAEMLAGGLALESTLTTILGIVTLLNKYARNKKQIWRDTVTGVKYLIIYDNDGSTELMRKSLKDPSGADISNIVAGAMALENASGV